MVLNLASFLKIAYVDTWRVRQDAIVQCKAQGRHVFMNLELHVHTCQQLAHARHAYHLQSF
eukprot:5069601-Amphidinium_carterae.1